MFPFVVLFTMITMRALSTRSHRHIVFVAALLSRFIQADAQSTFQKTYGRPYYDEGFGIDRVDDGYVLTGQTTSGGGNPNYQIYLVRTDQYGDMLWSKTYGGVYADKGSNVRHTLDGGFVIAGSTTLCSGCLPRVTLIKTDANGDTLWTKAYGATYQIETNWVEQTADSGYVITGIGSGAMVIKTDGNGDTLWTKRYFVTNDDRSPHCIKQTADGGYILVGNTKPSPNESQDLLVIRTDVVGDTLWTRSFSQTAAVSGASVLQVADGGFVIAGAATATLTGLLLLKLDAQ